MMRFYVPFAAAAFAGSAAFAAGPAPVAVEPEIYVAPAPAFSWAGFYAGAGLGYGSTNYNLSGEYADGPDSIAIELPELGGRGGLASLQAGYNFMLSDTMVAGIQLDGTYSAINNTTAANLVIDGDTLDAEYRLAPRTMLTIAGRLGYLPTPDTMIYGLLGYTRANYRGVLEVDVNGVNVLDDSYSFSRNGAAIGMGIETRVSSNATLALEYRYNHMQRYSFIDETFEEESLEIGFDPSIQTIRAMLNFHF